MRAILVVLSGLIAIAVGIEAYVVVFFAPVLIYGSDSVLLAWGWIAPFLGLPVGALFAWLAFLMVDSRLQRSLATGSGGWFKASAVISLSLVGVALVAHAMQTAGDVDVSWSEEVRLNDGTQVLVKRRAIGNAFGRSKTHPEGWLPSEYTIEVSTVASFSTSSVWRSSLRPVLLDRDSTSNGWYLLAEPIDCARWYTMGKPSPPYLMYVGGAGGWVEERVDAKLVGKPANLLVSPRFTGEDMHVSASARQQRNDWGPPDTRPIVRAVSKC